jgi:hypothetical protein
LQVFPEFFDFLLFFWYFGAKMKKFKKKKRRVFCFPFMARGCLTWVTLYNCKCFFCGIFSKLQKNKKATTTFSFCSFLVLHKMKKKKKNLDKCKNTFYSWESLQKGSIFLNVFGQADKKKKMKFVFVTCSFFRFL